MTKVSEIVRIVPNYSLSLKEFLTGIYDWEGLKGLHYIIKGMGKSNATEVQYILGEEITVHKGAIFYEKHFDCQKMDLDELDIINKLEAIKEFVQQNHLIEFRPYISSMILFDNGTLPNNAQIISKWDKNTHIDPNSELGKLISPEMSPLEPIIMAKPKKNKKGFLKIDKKKIFLEINNEILFLKAKKVCHYSHNLPICKLDGIDNLFHIITCEGQIKQKTISEFIGDEVCKVRIPEINKKGELIDSSYQKNIWEKKK